MSLSKLRTESFRTAPLRKQAALQLITPKAALPQKSRSTTFRKNNVKKPGGAKPGFVVYYTNYSLMAEPDITGIQEVPSGK